MKETDIQKLMALLCISRNKAIDLISKNLIDLNVLNEYDMIGKEVNRITDKYKPEFDKLSDKIAKAKEDLVDSMDQTKEQDSVQ